MSSFSCPHFNEEGERCRRVDDLCVPGRTGCVLRGNSKFAVPAEERLAARRAAARQDEEGGDEA